MKAQFFLGLGVGLILAGLMSWVFSPNAKLITKEMTKVKKSDSILHEMLQKEDKNLQEILKKEKKEATEHSLKGKEEEGNTIYKLKSEDLSNKSKKDDLLLQKKENPRNKLVKNIKKEKKEEKNKKEKKKSLKTEKKNIISKTIKKPDTRRYYIQLGVYKEYKNAKEIFDKINDFTLEIVKRKMYILLLKDTYLLNKAQSISAKIKKEYHITPYIRVKYNKKKEIINEKI